MSESSDPGRQRDPFAPVEASPRFATPIALLALLFAVLAVPSGLAPLLGPIGMALGLIAHVKGSRLGFPAAVIAGTATILGMTLIHYLR